MELAIPQGYLIKGRGEFASSSWPGLLPQVSLSSDEIIYASMSGMTIVIRQISANDIFGFWKVLDSVARERRYLALRQAPPLAELEKSLRMDVEQDVVRFVALDTPQIVGWCDISSRLEPGFTHIGRLGMGVRADYRGLGIGRRLLTAALEKAVADGLMRIELDVLVSNVPAIQLFKSAGFAEEGIRKQARYVDEVGEDMVVMALLPHSSCEQHTTGEARNTIVTRIEREAGVPGLTGILARLPPTDRQSILLEVYRVAAERRPPARVLADYLSNRLVRPSKLQPAKLVEWESMALAQLPAEFEAIELAPTCPLGTSSVIADVDQNWAVSTIRNTEVVSDPTNVLALECASRRRPLRSVPSQACRCVHLAARHRVLRPQRFTSPDAVSHFSLFSLCSAGRDTGGREFEISTHALHIRFLLKLLRAFGGAERQIVLSLTDFRALDQSRLEREILAPIQAEFVNVVCTMNQQRTGGRGYYIDICYKLHLQSDSGELIELADGGSVGWGQRLLSDSKERMVISGIGSDRACDVFRRPSTSAPSFA